jgi:hypothetical protein
MSNPCAKPPTPHRSLGVDGSDEFIAAADGEVYRYDQVYWRWYSSLRGWPTCSTARRIAMREDERARDRARSRAAVEAARMTERRK